MIAPAVAGGTGPWASPAEAAAPSPPGGPPPSGGGSPADTSRPLRRDSLLMMTSTIAVGIGNYGFSLALVWVLPVHQFALVAALSTVLVVAATAANSALPWVLAREVGRHPGFSPQRRQAAGFTLAAALGGGLVAAAIVVALAVAYASPGQLGAVAVATVAIFVVQVGIGYLQGGARFRPLAVLAIVEVAIKASLGIGLAGAGLGATGALIGAAVAAAVWAVIGLAYVGRDIAPPTRAVAAALWRRAASIGGVQVGVIALSTLDVLVGSIRFRGASGLAGYQAMLVFSRVPLFVSGAVSAVAYPRMVTSPGNVRPAVREALTLYLIGCVAVVSVVMTIPARLIGVILPHHYTGFVSLLVPLGIAGMAAGQINVVTTFSQAEDRFRPLLRLLWPGVALAAVAMSFVGSSVHDLAWTSAAANATVAAVLTALAARRYGWLAVGGRTVAGVAAVAVLFRGLHPLRSDLPAWLVVAAVLALAALAAYQSGHRRPARPVAARATSVTAALLGSRLLHRRVLSTATRVIARLRPLSPPPAWELILAARSAAGHGPLITVPRARRVLVVAPHPDDETIGCGGTAALLAARGAEVTVVVTSSGEHSVASPEGPVEVSRQRRAEAVAACRALGTRPPVFLGLPDGAVGRNVATLTRRLDEVMAGVRPQVVFAPWPLDGHADHQAVAAALADCDLPAECEVWTYEVWTSLPANRIVDVTEFQDRKTQALGCHRTGRETFDLDSHLALGRWRSIFGLDGHGHAEAFLALTPEQFRTLTLGPGR